MGIAYKTYIPYLKICKDAAEQSSVWKSFRHNEIFTGIVGGIPYEVGADCETNILNTFGNDSVLLDKFMEGDLIGQPPVYFYKKLGRYVSSATMRYINVLINLLKIYKDLRFMSIVEIGGGYGGQCKVIHDFVKPKSYTLIDFPEALMLSKKYLEHFGIDAIYKNPDKGFSKKITYGLCISNYAYSEMEVERQMFYDDAIVSNSKRGYMLCNFVSKRYMAHRFRGMIQHRRKQYQILPEIPLTAPGNFLFIW